MKKNLVQKFALFALVLSLTACGSMTTREKSTLGGAVIGAAAGAVISDGGVLGTVGGAAAGGVIGNQLGK